MLLTVAQPPMMPLVSATALPFSWDRMIWAIFCAPPMVAFPKVPKPAVKFTVAALLVTKLPMVRTAEPMEPGVAVIVLPPCCRVEVPNVSVEARPGAPFKVIVPPWRVIGAESGMRLVLLKLVKWLLSMSSVPKRLLMVPTLAIVALSWSCRVPPRIIVAPS